MSTKKIRLSTESPEHNPHTFRTEMGESLRKIRENRGLTQEELAQKICTSRSTISKIESGKFNFSIDYLSRFANYFQFNIVLTDCYGNKIKDNLIIENT